MKEPTRLSNKRVKQAMLDANWPPSMLAPLVEAKLHEFARVIEQAVLCSMPTDMDRLKDDNHCLRAHILNLVAILRDGKPEPTSGGAARMIVLAKEAALADESAARQDSA